MLQLMLTCLCVCLAGFGSLSGFLWFPGDGLSAGGKEDRHRASHGLSPEPYNSQPYHGKSQYYYSPKPPLSINDCYETPCRFQKYKDPNLCSELYIFFSL